MNDILQNVSASSLVTAIENNLFEFLPLFGFCPQAEVHDEPDLLWSLTDIPFPLFNSIMRARLSPDDVDASIEAAITRGRDKNVPLLWWTGPTTEPPDMGLYLEKHGFTREDDSPGMALDLQSLNTDFTVPEGLTFEKVNDVEGLNQWHPLFAAGFGLPDFAVDALIDLFRQISFGNQLPLLHYTGWLKGKPVSAGSVYFAAGVAGIYNVVTVPEVRRKGIGTLMTLALLQEARMAGYGISVLHTSKMGFNVYRQLGFQEYCSTGQYLWSPE